MARTRWDSEEIDPTVPVKATTARGSTPNRAALGPAMMSTALRSQDGALREVAAVGSANFTFRVPIAHFPGRGLPLALDLVYNSRLWQRTGDTRPNMVFDIDEDWPAPGWSLHFGKLVRVGPQAAMFVEPDGSRHPFHQDRQEPRGTGVVEVFAHTIDGSGINYSFIEETGFRTLRAATVLRPDGTSITFHTPTSGRRDTLYAERISDADGNTITIDYSGDGPFITTVTDTCGRVVSFHAESRFETDLGSIWGPAPGHHWDEAQVANVELARFLFDRGPLTHSFADPVAEGGSSSTFIRGIYLPATESGFWLGAEDYSTYGMLKRVTACRMSVSSAPPGLPHWRPGRLLWQREYDYPDAGIVLADSPTYRTVTESWEGQDGAPAVTKFEVQSEAAQQRTVVTWPDGAKTITEVSAPIGNASGGLLSSLSVLDLDGRKVQQVKTHWQTKADGAPQVDAVEDMNALGGLAKTTFAYEPDATSPSIIDQWDYRDFQPSTTVLRRTHTQYERDQGFLNRNLRNLPKVIRVLGPFNALDPNGPAQAVVASRTEYRYDESERIENPGVMGYDARFNPNSPSYDWRTVYRGNATTVTRFSNAATHADPIVEKRTYDQCGNLRSLSLGVGRTEYLYRPEARYMSPSATRLTSTDSTDGTTLEVSATSYFSDGRPSLLTDANGEHTELQYDRAGRVTQVLNRGAAVDIVHNDDELTQTRTVRDKNNPGTIAQAEKLHFDGYGRILSKQTVVGFNGWSTVDHLYDQRGRIKAVSAPHWQDDAAQWTRTEYDALHRPIRVSNPTGDVTLWRYDEVAAPTNVPSSLASRVRITVPRGTERYVQYDALGRLKAVVEPHADSSGSVYPWGNSLTEYSYDPNGNITQILTRERVGQRAQTRQFRYDSLSRLVRQLLPECGRGIVEPPGLDGLSVWSTAQAYDERSNLVFRKDSRGAITRYEYQGDPLDRLHSIQYDNTEVTDESSVVLPCADVYYDYETEGDIRRVHQELAFGVCGQAFVYDSFVGLVSTTLTMTDAPNFPFTVDYPHDSLGRRTGVIHPKLYGGTNARPAIGVEYQTGAPLWVTLDGEELASHFDFSAMGAIKQMRVGAPGPFQVTEEYDYDGSHLELTGQRLTRDGVRLLDLTYTHSQPTFGPGHHGLVRQIETVADHLDAVGGRAYSYDALDRLEVAAGGELPDRAWTQTYSYDPWGNRTGVTAGGEFAPGQAATADGTTPLTYNQDTNQLLLVGDSPYPVRYDAAGNLLVGRDPSTGLTRYYLYDTAGRLVRVAGATIDVLDTVYVYGACNRRRATALIRHHVPDPDPIPDPMPTDPTSLDDPNKPYDTIESTTYYAWDGDHVIAEYNNPGPERGDALTWSKSRVFLGSRLLSETENLGNGDSRVFLDHPGLVGTRYVTGSTASVAHEALPFGSSVLRDGGAPSFESYARDQQTGLDYAVNRFYSPVLGRFVQPDPLGPAGFPKLNPQRMNLYSYCANDPVNLVDPLGLETCVQGVCFDDQGNVNSNHGEPITSPEITVTGVLPDVEPVPLTPGPAIDADKGTREAGGNGDGRDGGGPVGGGYTTDRPKPKNKAKAKAAPKPDEPQPNVWKSCMDTEQGAWGAVGGALGGAAGLGVGIAAGAAGGSVVLPLFGTVSGAAWLGALGLASGAAAGAGVGAFLGGWYGLATCP